MNGVIDLTTGALLPHDQEYLMTKLVQVDYQENAKCPNWIKVLETIMKDEAAM
jgi:putative DNA primase/helicase